MDWKDEYAESLAWGGYKRPYRPVVLHHVHPGVAGAAHCSPSVNLDMNNVQAERPTGDMFCANCRRLYLRMKEISEHGGSH